MLPLLLLLAQVGQPDQVRSAPPEFAADIRRLSASPVEAMLRIDPARARTLFEDIPMPDPADGPCQQAWAQDEHLHLLERLIGAMYSPVQVAPLARMITQAKLCRIDGGLLLPEGACLRQAGAHFESRGGARESYRQLPRISGALVV